MKISIRVKTRAPFEKIEKRQDEYIVYVKAAPIENEANEAIIKLLAEYFHFPKSCVSIKSGFTSKRKIVEISQM